jgi:hypothetical protein
LTRSTLLSCARFLAPLERMAPARKIGRESKLYRFFFFSGFGAS